MQAVVLIVACICVDTSRLEKSVGAHLRFRAQMESPLSAADGALGQASPSLIRQVLTWNHFGTRLFGFAGVL